MNCSTLGTNMDPVMQPQEHMEVPFTEMLKAISAQQEETITMLNRMNEALFLICNQPKEEKPIKCMNDALMAICEASVTIRANIESLLARIGL